MITISSLLEKIKEFSTRRGQYSIGLIEFLDLLKTMVNKIQEIINGSAISMIYQPDVPNIAGLNEIANPQKGWACKVLDQQDEDGNAYIYQYDGNEWNRTPFTSFPENVAKKDDLIPLQAKTMEILSGGIEIDGIIYPFALVDPISKKVSFAVDSTGRFVSFAHPLLQIDTNRYEHSVDEEILFAIKDENNKIAFAIYKDGTSYASLRDNGNSNINPFPQFTDYNYILLNGQSLGAGEQSFPAITVEPSQIGTLMSSLGVRTWDNNYGADPSLRPESTLVPIKENIQETIGSGLVNSFKSKLLGLFSNNDKNIIPFFVFGYSGQGGRYLRELDKRHDDAKDERAGGRRSNGGYYKTGIDDIRRAKAYADSLGKTFSVLAWCWMQGEAEGAYMVNRWDGALDSETFLEVNKADYLNLIEDYVTDILAITGQKVKPLFLCYKTSGWVSGRTQFELMLENKLIMVAPLYILPMAQNAAYMSGGTQIYGDPIHLANDGERWLGEQFSKVLRRITMDAEDWKPFYPVDSYRSADNTEIYVRFNVPRPPLVFDSNFVVKAQDFGFYIKQNNQNKVISSVSVFSADTIKITMSAPLTADDALLNYGHWQSQNTVSVPISDIKAGALTGTGFATTDFVFAGDIRKEFVIAQKDGTFRIRNASGAVATVRKVSFDGVNTLLNVEDREKGALAIGNSVYLSRFRSWGNLRDSDNELSMYEFGDPVNGRSGRYPLWNWCIDFLNFKI